MTFAIHSSDGKGFGAGRPHVLIVDGGPDDWDTTLLHPEDCPIAISTVPYFDWYTSGVQYLCQVADEVRHVGFDSMFPKGLNAGYFVLDAWAHRTPSTPNGPEEYDAGVEATRIS